MESIVWLAFTPTTWTRLDEHLRVMEVFLYTALHTCRARLCLEAMAMGRCNPNPTLSPAYRSSTTCHSPTTQHSNRQPLILHRKHPALPPCFGDECPSLEHLQKAAEPLLRHHAVTETL
ncbi:hypothetical protein M3J09_010109 [Ascochyta lentis]